MTLFEDMQRVDGLPPTHNDGSFTYLSRSTGPKLSGFATSSKNGWITTRQTSAMHSSRVFASRMMTPT